MIYMDYTVHLLQSYRILLTLCVQLKLYLPWEVFIMPPGKKIRMDITIDPELQNRMIKVCQMEDRSMSNLITVALKQYISKYEKRD